MNFLRRPEDVLKTSVSAGLVFPVHIGHDVVSFHLVQKFKSFSDTFTNPSLSD